MPPVLVVLRGKPLRGKSELADRLCHAFGRARSHVVSGDAAAMRFPGGYAQAWTPSCRGALERRIAAALARSRSPLLIADRMHLTDAAIDRSVRAVSPRRRVVIVSLRGAFTDERAWEKAMQARASHPLPVEVGRNIERGGELDDADQKGAVHFSVGGNMEDGSFWTNVEKMMNRLCPALADALGYGPFHAHWITDRYITNVYRHKFFYYGKRWGWAFRRRIATPGFNSTTLLDEVNDHAERAVRDDVEWSRITRQLFVDTVTPERAARKKGWHPSRYGWARDPM